MQIPFYKYQGTGNDFVMIDNRKTVYLRRKDTKLINKLCDRRFGVGADGLILLQNHRKYDFEMVYFNADGRESSMCGNGGRCIVAFAKFLKMIQQKTAFLAIDGPHEATIDQNNWVSLKMIDVPKIEQGEDYFLLNTGSPHYVVFVEDIDDIDVVENGQAIRYSKRFKKEGVNVNFVEETSHALSLIVATYERGVEDETLSCGTGVTAAAIAYGLRKKRTGEMTIPIVAKGGKLAVQVKLNKKGQAKNVWLSGPAERVFSGYFNVL